MLEIFLKVMDKIHIKEIAFLEGNHIGNCSFERVSSSRRNYHRAGIGIALFQEYTGFGYGEENMMTIHMPMI